MSTQETLPETPQLPAPEQTTAALAAQPVPPPLPEIKRERTPQEAMFEYAQRVGKMMSMSGYFADAKEWAQAGVKILAGCELGIPALSAMTGIYVIKGQISMAAVLMGSQLRRHGYDYRIRTHSREECVIEFFGKPDPKTGERESLGESSFSMADAETGGLADKDNWQKWPRNLLFARAMSNGCKWHAPEIFGGAPVYTPEELGAEVDERGELLPGGERHAPRPLDTLIDPTLAGPIYAAYRQQGKTRAQVDAAVARNLAGDIPIEQIVAQMKRDTGVTEREVQTDPAAARAAAEALKAERAEALKAKLDAEGGQPAQPAEEPKAEAPKPKRNGRGQETFGEF